jgi:teichuronic acid biosynthesis glycosyltransferase TuaG
MPEMTPLVSIIIPAYNAAEFLKETIESVKTQGFTNWEMIVVNDGSTDNTGSIVREENDGRVKLLEQSNLGVSAARNNGLRASNGKYIVFLDADDIMGSLFIDSRVKALEENKTKGFSCGWVETFPVVTPLRRGVAIDPEKEILFFDPQVTTVPSNYLISTKVLLDNGIQFNKHLSSSADRFFLLQLTRHTEGIVVSPDTGRLLYRISSNSMSHKINPGLIFDNATFYKEVKKAGLQPSNRNHFKSKFFFSLSLGFAKTGKYSLFVSYLFRSALAHPAVFSQLIIKKIKTAVKATLHAKS